MNAPNPRTAGWIGIGCGLIGHVLVFAFPAPSLLGIGFAMLALRGDEQVLGGLGIWFSLVAAAEAMFLNFTLKGGA